jgi:3-hydroxyisobutyrate dehydrogenase-like beta-hydroxyacid dehydrogenase
LSNDSPIKGSLKKHYQGGTFMKTKIGFVGLGRMGKWMALNLLKAGYDLTVLDINSDAEKFLTAQGAAAGGTPAGMVKDIETVFLSLTDTGAVEEVIFGESGLVHGASRGLNIVDLSTISYVPCLAFAEKLKAQGILFSDAPVSGMEARAKDATLTIMFGGYKKIFERLRPLLDVLGNEVIYMGEVGCGQLTKLINQLLFNISVAGIAEILPMAAKLGLDPEKVSRVVTTGTGRSFAAEFFTPLILENCFDSGYPLKHAYKDFVSAAEICAGQQIPLPLVQAAMTTFQMALAQGHGDEDKGALIKVFEELLKVKFRKEGETV